MSKRPNVKTRTEKKVVRETERKRKARNAEMKKASKAVKVGKVPEPYILSFSRGPVEGDLPRGVAQWIEEEAADQSKHYKRIYREVEKLAPLRDEWVKEFLARISGPRGFSVHAGTRRTIPKRELPKKPRRPWRVVW
ncbi:MAG: hypothetical protein AAF604_06330 [Acidobacteriota bacterium]